MKLFKAIALLSSFVFTLVAFAPKAQADTYNKKTVLTFTEPFEVPGVDAQILPAGTYVFKLLDSSTDRDMCPNLQRGRNPHFHHDSCNPLTIA